MNNSSELLKNNKKYEIWAVYGLSLILLGIAVTRASVQGITYDEAYTYIRYALPIAKTTLGGILNDVIVFSKTALANNHWLNTLLISFVTMVTRVEWSEFLIRLPVLLFGGIYYFGVARFKLSGKINLAEFIFLEFSYYLNEYFSLARGYGMCVCLVFLGIMYYKSYCDSGSNVDLWIGIFALVISTYANSVSLIICFAVAAVFVLQKLISKDLRSFILKNKFKILIVVALLLYIVYYHFRVSDIEAGMPLYMEKSPGLIHYVRQFFFLCFYIDGIPAPVAIGVFAVFAVIVLFAVRKNILKEAPVGLSLLICCLMLLLMDVVFRRGGLMYRTLLPFYPLLIIGLSELISCAIKNVRMLMKNKSTKKLSGRMYIAMLTVISLAIIVINFRSFNIRFVNEWSFEKNVKYEVYSGDWHCAIEDDPSYPFYENQMEWNLNRK